MRANTHMLWPIVLCAGLIFAPPAVANSCLGSANPAIQWSTPLERFTDNGNGTVSDTLTGLTWMRCPLGQTWDGGSCNGEVTTLDWQGALQTADAQVFAGFADWRLPNLKELSSVVEQRCRMPALNHALFPAAAADLVSARPVDPQDPEPDAYVFWTSSPFAENAAYSWTIDLKSGFDMIKTRHTPQSVRLVRSGP